MGRYPKIRKGDEVHVIAGKDRGKSGRVMDVFPDRGRLLVEGVNMIKKAVKPNPQKNIKGGIVEREAPIHISNVAVIDPVTNAPTRVHYEFLEDGSKVRVSRQGNIIDQT